MISLESRTSFCVHLVNEFDPLRDDGEAYALRLREVGVTTWTKRLSGLIHASIHMLGLTPDARRLFDEARFGVRQALQQKQILAGTRT